MERGSCAPLILKEQDEISFDLSSKSELKIYFKCFRIKATVLFRAVSKDFFS